MRNLRTLRDKDVDAVKRRLARYISGELFLNVIRASDSEMETLAANWPGAKPANDFVEPESHRKARAILGEKNFHGVAAAEKHIRPFTEAEREEHREIRIRDHRTGELLTEEQSLAVLEECKGEFVLCAMHHLDLPGVHAKKKERFNDDPDSPWFGKKNQRTAFSGAEMRDAWVLMRRTITPKSHSKNASAQGTHLGEQFPKERFALPAEFAEVAIIHFLETGEKLADGFVVRFQVRAAGGDWVRVFWLGGRLFFDWDPGADGHGGSLSVRTSV